MNRAPLQPAPASKKDAMGNGSGKIPGIIIILLACMLFGAIVVGQCVFRRLDSDIGETYRNEAELLKDNAELKIKALMQEHELSVLRAQMAEREQALRKTLGDIRAATADNRLRSAADVMARADYVVKIEVNGKETKDDAETPTCGTGIIRRDSSGALYVLTVAHVSDLYSIRDAYALFQRRLKIAPQPLTLIARDAAADIAVYRFADVHFVYSGETAMLDEADDVLDGDHVAAIGWSMGLWPYVSEGIVGNANDCGRNNHYNQPVVLLHSAPINPGESGGPVISLRTGNVIGMTVSLAMGSQGAGGNIANAAVYPHPIAVPACDIAKVLPRMLHGEYPIHGAAQCAFFDSTRLTAATLERFGLARPAHEGVYIPAVDAPSNAYSAGLRAGDRVVSANGIVLENAAELERLIFFSEPGTKISFVIEREGALYRTEFALEIYVPIPHNH